MVLFFSNLKNTLGKGSGGTEISENIIEDIKGFFLYYDINYIIIFNFFFSSIVRCCFVTSMDRALQFTSNSNLVPCSSVQYPLQGHSEITIPGKVRETTFEFMFEEDNDHQSVTSMILDAILKCSIDMRRSLAENILIIGGGAMVPGFKARLREELNEHIKSDRYKNKLHIDKFKFHSPPSKDNYTAWLGGMRILI